MDAASWRPLPGTVSDKEVFIFRLQAVVWKNKPFLCFLLCQM